MSEEAMPAPALRRAPKSDVWSGGVLALLMLIAFGVVAGRMITIATGPLPPGPGVPAPAFQAKTIQGAPLALEAHRGKVLVVDFWATWCPPCVASMPGLERVSREYKERGVVVLGVNQEPGNEANVQRFLKRRNITFPSVVDPGEIHRSYGVYTFPTSFVIDRKGVIKKTFRGLVSERRLRAAIEDALEKGS